MIEQRSRNKIRSNVHARIRRKMEGTAQRPRLNVYRSLNHIYAQLVDDLNGVTLVSASTAEATEAAARDSKSKAAKASDGDAKGKDHAACATKCMASGVPAGILPEGKKAEDMMYLLTNPTVLAPYAGQTIKVEGVAHADMHGLDVKKLYVKDGDNWKEVQLKDEHHKMAGADDHKDHEHK